MKTKIPVKALFEYCSMMLQAHWGYIMGTAGVMCTQSVIDTAIDRFPNNAEITKRYGKKWLGHMVTDCSGLIVYIYKQFGLKIPHGSSSMVRQGYIVDCGPTPHPGWAAIVDDTPDTPDNDHIGIIQADGVTVVEARGTESGVVTSKVTDKKWTKFGRFKDVDYSQEVDPMPDGERVIYRAKVTTQSGPLNMRSGNGTEFPIIGRLPKGEIVDVMVECPNGWMYIDDDGDQGYVDGRFLTRVQPAEQPDDKTPADDEKQPQIEKYTVLRRTDGVQIMLEGEWKVEKGD